MSMLELERVASGYGRSPVLHERVARRARGRNRRADRRQRRRQERRCSIRSWGWCRRSRGVDPFRRAANRRASRRRRSCAPASRRCPERRQLFGTMTVEENLRMGAYTRRAAPASRAALEEQFRALPDPARAPAPAGADVVRRRAADARHRAREDVAPRLLLLDEPSLGLAPLLVARIMASDRALRAAGGTVLVVEQNARAALAIADRGYVMENGRITHAAAATALLSESAASRTPISAAAAARAHAPRKRASALAAPPSSQVVS